MGFGTQYQATLLEKSKSFRNVTAVNRPAKLSDLIGALQFESPEHLQRFDRARGRIVNVERSILSAVEEQDEDSLADTPDWQKEEIEIARAMVEDPGRFILAPNKFDFHEYRHIERFIGSLSDSDAAEQLSRAIRGKGAFRYFRDTIGRLGLVDDWHEFRDAAMKRFVIDWAEANQVAYEDDLKPRRG